MAELQTGDLFTLKGMSAFPMLKLDTGYFDIRNEVVGEDQVIETLGYEMLTVEDAIQHIAFNNYTKKMVRDLIKDRLKKYNK